MTAPGAPDLARLRAVLVHPGVTTAALRPPHLVVLVGVPGSGKTTLARQLAARLPAQRLNSDEARFALVERPTYDAAESRRLFAALETLTADLLGAGHSVVFDATNVQERDRGPLVAPAADAAAHPLLVHVTAPEAVVLERLRTRQRQRAPGDRSEAGETVYRRMAARFEPIHGSHLRVNTPRASNARSRR